MSNLWFLIFGFLGIVVGVSAVRATSAKTRAGRSSAAVVAVGVAVIGIFLWWSAFHQGVRSSHDGYLSTSTDERWLLVSAFLGFVVGACAALAWMAMAEGFSVERIVKFLAVLVVSLPVAVIVVGNVAPSVTWWEHEAVPTSADPNENYVAEVQDPPSCGPGNSTAHLVIRGVGTFVKGPYHYADDAHSYHADAYDGDTYDADATLPDDAAFTGWHTGERELWVETSVSQGWGADLPLGFDPGGTPPNAVYIVSPWGVERWPRSVCG